MTTSQINGLIIDGNAWMVAGEVAKSLGHREAADITRLLDEDEKGTHIVRTPGGPQAVSFVSEAGLFKVILQRRLNRRLPGATVNRIERFQRLVFHDVLPTIQRTGAYPADAAQPAAPAVTAVGMLEALKDPATVLAPIEHHARETLAERAAHAVTHQRLEESSADRRLLQGRVEADRPAVLA